MRQLFWLLTFLLLLFGGDRLAGYFLQKQVNNSQFRYSRLYRSDAAAEILLVGNSRGLAFYQPYIEAVTGKKTFNLSYNGLPADLAKVLVQDYLNRYPDLKKIIVDITLCDRTNDKLIAGFLPYSGRSNRLDTLIHNKLPKMWWGGRFSVLFRCNNEVFQRALFYRTQTDENWLPDRAISPKLAALADKNSYDLDVHPYAVRQLSEMVNAARTQGISVELVIGPYFPGFKVKNLDALKLAAVQATGIPVRDYRNALSDTGMFSDFMHPNKKGSEAYMDLLKKDGVFGN